MHPSDINSGPEETGEKEYYAKQFATLRSFKEVESLNVPCVVDEALELEEQEQSEFAMKISNYANLALLGLKIYATVQSGSIAIIAASTLDSLLDLMAGGILWFTQLSTKNINIYKYPIGKLRVQPVGIVIFAAVMTTLGPFIYDVVTKMFLVWLLLFLGDKFYRSIEAKDMHGTIEYYIM